MATHRLEKINSLIQHEMAQIFLRELDFPSDTLVTITDVETNQDINQAKIFLSVLPFKRSGQIFSYLRKRTPYLQRLLNKKLCMHFIPNIIFALDPTENEAEKIEKLFDQINKK